VNKKESTEFSDADRALVDSAYDLLRDPRWNAFFALLDPHYEAALDLPMSTLIALQRTGAPFGDLALACEALIRMTDATGPAPNRGSHFDMLQLLAVLRSVVRVDVVLGGAS
jgi:hypothetical protein